MQLCSVPEVGVSLRKLLPDARFVGASDIVATSCTSDSRACQPGDLFVALPGTEADGHDFAVHAMARGAKAVLAAHPIRDMPLPICIAPAIRAAYGRVCQALVGNPSDRLKVIGITGTNGKTTSSYLAAAVLEAAGMPCGVIGTLGYFDGAEVGRTSLTTPNAAELAQLLARIESNGCSHTAIEASSHALDQDRLTGVTLDVAAITNVGHDHLDYHDTADRYLAAKAKIINLLRPEGFAVFNVDDPAVARLANQYDAPALTVAIHESAELSACPAERFISEQTFLLTLGDVTVPVRTPLIGEHNIYNCLIAAAVGEIYGADPAAIVRGLESVRQIPGRLERLECGQPFSVFVDYAHTPNALAAALDTLRPLIRGRLFCVFGAGGNRDPLKRPQMGRVAEAKSDLVVLTTDNPRSEDPIAIANQVHGGIRNHRRVHLQLDRARAIEFALEQAQEGDCVLIAGKGHETYQEIDGQRYYFDDRDVARQWLFSNARPTAYRQAA